MKDYISKRVIETAEYIIENSCTVRAAAKYFNVSKSTVHSDMGSKLKYLDTVLYHKVHRILDFNFSVRHIRGGEITRQKYLIK